ncbi:hypothetical protein KIN34_08235 [Cellulomonas sp. DKR-3]|uniref:AbiEi antitoxin C-terminal domain-containing protein n=1 Tax=Cellulomonas fulva TaxID=2835530 RepID=A0ABS5TYQ9_9CELL|nr:hypothetical protein [Cellulomonas fulva]MBT0994273.1 hypothetical protein [Cellulomonas fulva]
MGTTSGLVTGRGAESARRAGDVRVRRGAYVGRDHWDGLTPDERYLLAVQATASAARGAPLLSHWSAAAVWGLPAVGRPDDRVHITLPEASGGRSKRGVVRHTRAGEVSQRVHAGLLVTSAARTAIDLARVGGLASGLVAADAALRARLATPDELAAEVAPLVARRGARAARAVASLADARSESPGESLSRARMHEHGLPMPRLQHDVYDGRGFVGRVDFWWPELGVAGEFDGRVKYDDADGPDVLWREKVREDRLRALVRAFVRWTWDDAWRGGPMCDALRRAGVH